MSDFRADNALRRLETNSPPDYFAANRKHSAPYILALAFVTESMLRLFRPFALAASLFLDFCEMEKEINKQTIVLPTGSL